MSGEFPFSLSRYLLDSEFVPTAATREILIVFLLVLLPAGADANNNPPVYPDDTDENPNLPNGYWNLRRVIFDYIQTAGTPNGGPVPSHRKATRVFEIIAGDRYKSQVGLLQLLEIIAQSPANNPIQTRAELIFNDLYRRRIRDADLDQYQFVENE